MLMALALGAATDYVVGVGSRGAGLSGVSTTRTGPGVRGESWSVTVWRGARRDAGNISLTKSAPASWAPVPRALTALPHGPWRGAYARAMRDERIHSAFINTQAYGWPMRSWAGYFINSPERRVEGWLKIGSENYPFMPVWPGVLVNGAIFGCGWLLVLLVARRALRRRPRPGVCAECGYDLKGLKGDTCPECGIEVPVATAAG